MTNTEKSSGGKASLIAAIIFMIMTAAGIYAYFFVYAGGKPKPEADGGQAAEFVKRITVKKLPTEVFAGEKFKSLKTGKFEWTDDIKAGNPEPFLNDN